MLALLAAAALPPSLYAHPISWALNFADPASFVGVGDIDGDGYADLIRVYPRGDAFIDVARNGQGMKSLQPQRANTNWGKVCQAACFGDFDGDSKTDVMGIFDGDTLRLAHGFAGGSFKDEPEWMKLPSKLDLPHLTTFVKAGHPELVAWSEKSGEGYLIQVDTKLINTAKEIPGTRWEGGNCRMDSRGRVFLDADKQVLLGTMQPGRFPVIANATAGEEVFVDHPLGSAKGEMVRQLPTSGYADDGPCAWAAGDMDKDGDPDLVQFRFGPEAHSGANVLLHRRISPGETDSDHDGLTNEEEAILGTDPYNPDSDGDGLLDGWEVLGFRGLDMKAMGCDPRKIDAIVLVERFNNTKRDMVESTMKTIQGYYASLGWGLHPIWQDEKGDADEKKPWWQNRDEHIPSKWKGVVHFMQISPYGGGQADQLGDGGGCGGNDWGLYATFIHEFGHQLGLSHEGFFAAAWCPTYPSMMNYAYSYGYEGDIKKIRYSDGSLANYTLHETDLDETIPLPIAKVGFLAKAPYHYRLKEAGNNTLIDWNWNGVFGEKHVRADINYAYSTTAGRRDTVDKTQSAPWVFVHNREGYVLYAQHGVKADVKTDPSVSADKPGWLMLRRLISPFKWAEPIKIADSGVIGDPTAISFNGEIVAAYPTARGITVRRIRLDKDKVTKNDEAVFADATGSPSLGVYAGKLILFDWNPTNGQIRYRLLQGDPKSAIPQILNSSDAKPVISTVPVSMAVDTAHDQIILGLAQDQDKNRPTRWQIRRFKWTDGKLVPAAKDEIEWIEGEKGGARGKSRPIVLVDDKGLTGMKGRILYFGLGSVSAAAPWSCAYVAQSVADKTVGGGWMVKRYYDEWTQSRSAPAACWFNGDILYAYRWADGGQGASDNTLHVSYNGTGIESAAMGDFDDIGYMRSFGIRHSILYLRE